MDLWAKEKVCLIKAFACTLVALHRGHMSAAEA